MQAADARCSCCRRDKGAEGGGVGSEGVSVCRAASAEAEGEAEEAKAAQVAARDGTSVSVHADDRQCAAAHFTPSPS